MADATMQRAKPVPLTHITDICNVSVNQLPAHEVNNHQLLKSNMGSYHFVDRARVGSHYETHFYSSATDTSILLGTFKYEKTASLAHAMARKNVMFQTNPKLVQQQIEKMYADQIRANPEAMARINPNTEDLKLSDMLSIIN